MTDDLDRTRPVDCTAPEAHEDLPEVRPNVNSVAMSLYGKPYSDCTRREQRQCDRWVKGNMQELDARIKSLAKNNLLDASERVSRMQETQNELAELITRATMDTKQLWQDGDNMMSTSHPDYMKNASGTMKRKLLNLSILTKTTDVFFQTQERIAKIAAEKAAVVVKEGDRTLNVNLTPEDFKAELESAIKGEIVDQSGDGGGDGSLDND